MNGKRIVHYILVSASVIFMTSVVGCDWFTSPKNAWHDVLVTNTGDRTLYCAFQNPDPEHDLGSSSDYTIHQLLRADGGTATYQLHERSAKNAYLLDVFNSDQIRIRTIKIYPDAQMNDHGSWDVTVNAWTGAVQFRVNGRVFREFLPDKDDVTNVVLN